MAFQEQCCRYAIDLLSAPIAPTALQTPIGKRRTLLLSTPPSAATAIGAARAMRAQRRGPRARTSTWLAVGKAGDRNARSAPARQARRRSATPCAELVTSPPRWRTASGQRPDRRCTPAPSAAASLPSPATTKASRRARQSRARSRPSAARSGSPSCRSTTPARPGGRPAAAGRGSGSRRASVNSHKSGALALRRPRAAAARAHATSARSTIPIHATANS